MQVYRWGSDLESRWLTTCAESGIDSFCFDGNPRASAWKAPKVEWILDGRGDTKRAITDCPNFFPGIPVLSAHAISALRPLLEKAGEILQLDYEGKEYFALNVTNVIAALDETYSNIVRYPLSGRIMRVKTFSFHERRLVSQAIFKEAHLARSDVFCTEQFLHAVSLAGLTGFQFHKVWPDGTPTGFFK